MRYSSLPASVTPNFPTSASVGTLKLWYPCYCTKTQNPRDYPLVAWQTCYVGPSCASPQSRAATLGPQQHPTTPDGRVRSCHVSREGGMLQSINSESGPPRESAGPPRYTVRTPGYIGRTSKVGPGPPLVQAGPPPPYGVRAALRGSKGPRTEHTWALNRA
jgi:hypothetical protein